MNEFNDFKQLRQNYSNALEKNIQKLQGRLKALNNNIINSTSAQKITITKNPTEVKSLRSSCLFTDNNLASPTDRFESSQVFANFNRYSSLDAPQANQGAQQSKQSPDVFENIFLKQSYIPYEQKQIKQANKTKQKNTQSNTLKITKKAEKTQLSSQMNSQSLQNIKKKDDISQDKTLKRNPEKKKNLIPPAVQQKTKNSSRSPLKQRVKQNKQQQQTPQQQQLQKPLLNEILKKFVSSKTSLSRTLSKSKSKSKSPEKESTSLKKKQKSRSREQAIHHYNEQITSQFSPIQDKFQIGNTEYSPSLLRQVRTLSKKKTKSKSKQQLQQQQQQQQQLINSSPSKVSEIHTLRLKHLLRDKTCKQEKKVRTQQIRTTESPIQIKDYKIDVPQIKSLEDQQKDDSKPSSVRLNTLSIQRSDEKDSSMLMNIFHELKNLSEDQIQQFQQILKQIRVERKDEELQTSLMDLNQVVVNQKVQSQQNQKNNIIETHLKMALEEFPKKSHASSPMSNSSFIFKKEFLTNTQIEEICHQREKSIKLRVGSQMQAFQTLLQQQKISPRSFHHNKQLVQSWFSKQADQLQKFKCELQKVQKQSNTLLKKTEQDVIIVKDLKKDQMLVLSQLQQISFDQSEIKDESFLDQSDLQFSIPNSPKIVTPNTKFLNQIHDRNEIKIAQQQSISSQSKQNQFSKPFQQDPKRKDFEISTFNEELYIGNQIARPLQVSPNNESKQIIQDLYREPQVQIQNLSSALRVEEEAEKIIEQLVDEASNSLNKIELIRQYAYQTNAGILTNLGVINNFIDLMCFAIIESYQKDFLLRMNIPYGRKPISRLRQIHGQDDFEDHQKIQPLYQIKQIVESQNQYEKIHNQAIFDAFNEALNSLRPFYLDEGVPYPWCIETNITQRLNYGIEDIPTILERARQKVFDWSKALCGLLSDDIPVISVKQLTYQQLILMQESQGNDSLAYINEERIQNCLQIELQEGERKWFQITQEYSEVLMEISDYLFEELTEEMVIEVFMK